MAIKAKIKRYIHGGGYLLKSVFYEKPRGLDFSLRRKTKGITTKGNLGYALTHKKAFDNMMKRLDIDNNDSFIDIGCGKGGCLLHASKYPFKRIAGIEIEEILYKVAVNNFKKLKMPHIELYKDNAVTFGKYDEFNVFFLFNPFDKDTYKKVIDRILSTFTENRKDDRAFIICYGGTITDYIKEKGVVEQLCSYTDHVRERSVVIWKWKK